MALSQNSTFRVQEGRKEETFNPRFLLFFLLQNILTKLVFLYLFDGQINNTNITRYMIQITSLYLLFLPCPGTEAAFRQETQDPILTETEMERAP